jgi:hypothetical protein
MADFNFEIPDDYLKDLLDNDFDKMAPEILNEVVPILDTAIRRNLGSVIKDGSGKLMSSIRITRPKKTKTDAWITNVHPSGRDNNLKAIWLNYGNVHQAPRSWLTPAVNSCQTEIYGIIQRKWEEITRANK